jgi:hypothetical protein
MTRPPSLLAAMSAMSAISVTSGRRGRRPFTLVLALALGALGIVLAAAPAAAQMAAALGKPLPSPDLPVGMVTVRIVAGSASSPVVGTAVTLVVNDVPREARTDSAGRASFPGLPPGATAIAKVVGEDKAEKTSEPFTIPESGGMRVMITTKPWQAGAAGAAPFAGGGGAGMPNPRQLSGEARAEQSDPPGSLTVRVTYDDFKDTPSGIPVVVMGYSADDTTTYQLVNTDQGGRAQFQDLDRSGGTSYFAMTLLPRNGATDRLISTPIVLESQTGVRMVLSSEKRDSTAPAIDDLAKGDPQIATPAGKVRVVLEGVGDLKARVTLIDASTRKPIGESGVEASPPDPTRVQGGAQFEADAKLPPGTLDIAVLGGPGQAEEPLKDVEIRVIPASSKDGSGGLASVTGADGTVRMALQVTEPQKAVFTINGRQLVSQPFDLGKSGGKLMIRARWDETGRPQAVFDVPVVPGRVVYAETVVRGQHYRSMPLPLLEATGSKVSIYVYPRTLFRFQLDAEVEDELFAVRGNFEVTNYAWAPYRAGPDGMVVPLPRGFKGAIVGDTDQSQVSVSPGEGYRLIRPIPPGGRKFRGAFSLPVEHGQATWSFDLPIGTFESELVIKQTAGMTVHTPPGVPGESRTVPQGTFYVIAPITIKDAHKMEMSIDGMPSPPRWRSWVQGLVGLLVVAVMLGGVALAIFGRRGGAAAGAGATASAEARRQRLLDELVELERSGANPKRREQLLEELERLWG